MPEPRVVTDMELARGGLDSTWVCLKAKLVGQHWKQTSLVLEMQSDAQLFPPGFEPGRGGAFAECRQ